MSDSQNKTPQQSLLKTYARFSGLGFQIGLSFLAGVYGGKYLDEKLDTKPLFLVIGAILGMVAGFVGIFRTFLAKKNYKEKNYKDE